VRRLDADRDEGAGLLGLLDGGGEDGLEGADVRDHVVGREHDHRGVRVLRQQPGRSVGDGRGGVPAHRLGEDVGLCEGGEVVPRLPGVARVGHHEHALGRDERLQPGERVLEEGLGAEDAEELLRLGLAAAGPEAAPHAAGHDHGVRGHQDGDGRGSGRAKIGAGGGDGGISRGRYDRPR